MNFKYLFENKKDMMVLEFLQFLDFRSLIRLATTSKILYDAINNTEGDSFHLKIIAAKHLLKDSSQYTPLEIDQKFHCQVLNLRDLAQLDGKYFKDQLY